ncbi:hypothetical protein ABFX02_11G098000 [Erythranthe guttata]
MDFENGDESMVWSEELERVPLKQRLKLLLASHRISVDSCLKSERRSPVLPPTVGVAGKEERENGHCDTQSGFCAEERMNEKVLEAERRTGDLELKDQENLASAPSVKIDSVGSSSLYESVCVTDPVTVKLECDDNLVEGSSRSEIQAFSSEPEMSDELDHASLKERLRGFLASKCLGFSSTVLEENYAGRVKGELGFGDQIHKIDGTSKSLLSRSTKVSSCKPHQALDNFSERNKSADEGSSGNQRNEMISSSETECTKNVSDVGKTLLSGDIRTAKYSPIPGLANIKTEPSNDGELPTFNLNTMDQTSLRNFVMVKSEVQTSDDAYEDELDHMLLRERMKLLPSKDGPSSDIHHTSQTLPSVASNPTHLKVNRPRKRRKTVTDSVETAMEEDAPGLLQVLIEKGVSVNDIKLYGEPECNDLDVSSIKDSFSELEEVISKLFWQRESFLKLGPMRSSKGEKASYCLECLFSLVEQARYLLFRKWPVEWGWCRDLQSFIFVFERHNRIVLERPEYGYATYFFELADSLPIDWQIKRLVTAMKLTSCSRVSLLENKALMVGDDLTEREARVLMEYGWTPNTGLGTMLNYYDRVVHDRKNETYASEWRSKIGKMLTDGYNGGTLLSARIPEKVTEYNLDHPMHVKLELS